jgi:S-adenosylmethionine hydrolase
VLSPSLLAAGSRAVALPVPPAAAPTFHGRDVFAPAAAQLALGTPLDALGSLIDEPVVRRTPEARRAADGSVVGEVIAIDRFGNAVTNLIAPRGGRVEIAGRSMPIMRTYADAPTGDLIALVGSIGFVEVAQRDGRAADALGVTRGTPVVLRAPRA